MAPCTYTVIFCLFLCMTDHTSPLRNLFYTEMSFLCMTLSSAIFSRVNHNLTKSPSLWYDLCIEKLRQQKPRDDCQIFRLFLFWCSPSPFFKHEYLRFCAYIVYIFCNLCYSGFLWSQFYYLYTCQFSIFLKESCNYFHEFEVECFWSLLIWFRYICQYSIFFKESCNYFHVL